MSIQRLWSDYADQRYYAFGPTGTWPAGRFLSPDPGGIRTTDPSNPSSWNRYTYAYDDPINFIDPSGEDACQIGGPASCSITVTAPMPPDPSPTGNGRAGNGQAFGGEGGGPSDLALDLGTGDYTPPDPIPANPCPDWAARFFGNIGIYRGMAKQIGVDVNFIMALSALESHWDDTHAQDLGNLFGLTNGGHNNIDFRKNKTLSEQAGYQASADYWTSHYGSKVAGAKDLSSFWSDLQPKKGKYNSKNSNYFSTLSDVYDSVLQRRQDCNK